MNFTGTSDELTSPFRGAQTQLPQGNRNPNVTPPGTSGGSQQSCHLLPGVTAHTNLGEAAGALCGEEAWGGMIGAPR